MAESLIQAELLAACSSIGYSDGVRYHKEAYCLETVKDLIRYLRRDDDTHNIRRALGETKVVQTDLIPIVKFHHKDKELFDVTLRLLVNLTNPVLLLYKEELPNEKITRQQFLQLMNQQQAFKEAFADEEFWNVIVNSLGEILNKDWDEREEEERLIVERILILVRNILSVAASPDEEKRTDDDASVHDQVLWALHLARFEDLLLYVSSSSNEQDLCMHVIEVISLMLKEQDATQLANAGLQRSQSEKEKDEKELLEMRKREALEKQQKIKKHYSARHSRFGGTYYVMNMKSISDRDIIAHKHISDIGALDFDHSKRPKKIPKNKMPVKDVDITRRSTLAIRLFLQEFCIEFLNGAFNSLMYVVKDNLNRAKAQEHDETYYLWSMKFFLEFNRNHNFRIELITETLNLQTFHYIQTLLENYYENMSTDKGKIPVWSKRMHRGLRAYQELLMTLSFMDKSDKEDIRESSKILKNKVFYVVEYRELVLILLQNFDERKMSRNYLKDLVATAHIFLKLLDGICGKQRHLVVQKKVKRKKSKAKRAPKAQPSGAPSEEELVMLWEEKSDHLLAVIKGEAGELPVTIPYDPVSDVPEEQQKETAMKKINSLLRKGEFNEALSLLRSSRDIWPEGNIFGGPDLDPLEELSCLRMIFMANINNEDQIAAETEEKEEGEEEDDSDEEEERREEHFSEQEFNFTGFVRRFSHIKVMKAYSLIFKDFFKNGEELNHQILKMFHRIAWDCKLDAIFFQASIFRTFQAIMDRDASTSRVLKDAQKFVKFIFRKFLEVSKVNKKVFGELLFWKTNKEALELEFGYGSQKNASNDTKKHWLEEEEDELRRLFEEFRDAGEQNKDVVDLIMENLINQQRTRRMIIIKLKSMNLVSNVKELSRKAVKTREPRQWTEEEVSELKMLFEEYKDAIHPIAMIMEHLSSKRIKVRVVEKILELGLVGSRKELNKKKSGKKSVKNKGEEFLRANEAERGSSDNDSSDSESEDDVSVNESLVSSRNKTVTHHSFAKIPTPEVVKAQLVKVLDGGWNEAVEWIAELLEETADERENDGDFEPVPIITLTETCSKAMENEEFLQLLRVIGIRSPQTHQEMFWRIPSNIPVDGLRKRASYLRLGINGELGNEPEQPNGVGLENGVRLTTVTVNSDDADGEGVGEEPTTYEGVNKRMNTNSDILQEIENSDNDAEGSDGDVDKERRHGDTIKVKSRKRKKVLLDSDDEKSSDTDDIRESERVSNVYTLASDEELEGNWKNSRKANGSSPLMGKRRVLTSDDESGDDAGGENVTIVRNSKKLKILDSDEE